MLPVFLVCSFSLGADASIQPVSQPGSSFAPAAGGDGSSGLPIVSADGRYVLFASTANNLVLTNNNNSVLPQRMNVFLRDRVSNTTTLVSVNLAGTGGGNGDSFPTAISTNDQFVLFESGASDLVANDTNLVNDVFVRDVINGITTLVSVSTNGGSANLIGVSRSSVMTPDGRYVAFVSTATNLVAGDTNWHPRCFRPRFAGGYHHAGQRRRETHQFQSTSCCTGTSESPEITPDGRYVVFYSTATNLVPGVATSGEVYVRDLLAGSTTWVSTDARAIFQFVTGSTNAASCNFSISDNGRFVAYEVCTNTPTGTPAAGLILRYHLATGLTDIISANANVPDLSPEFIHNLAMTPDGRFVALRGRCRRSFRNQHGHLPLGRAKRPEHARQRRLEQPRDAGNGNLRFAHCFFKWAIGLLRQHRDRPHSDHTARRLPCVSPQYADRLYPVAGRGHEWRGCGHKPDHRSRLECGWQRRGIRVGRFVE